MEADTTFRSARTRWMTHRRRCLGPAIVVGLALVLVAAACGAKVTPPTAASPIDSPPVVSPAQTPSFSPVVRTKVGTWLRLPRAPIPASVSASVWTGTETLFFGRVPDMKGGAITGGCHDVAAAYTPATRSWRKLSPPLANAGCFEGTETAVWSGSEMLVWGNVHTAYSPVTNRWRPLPEPPLKWAGPSVNVWTGRQMIGWGGGCCGDSVKDGLAYTPSTNSWEVLPPAPISGRHATGTWTGTEMIIVGGADADGHSYADGAAYNPVTRSWRRLPPMPQPRFGATVVWDGTEVLVVGGEGAFETTQCRPCADGVAYNPSTNRWRRLPGMKFARSGHVAVWTGTQLLVWGGVTDLHETVPPHGVAYHPATDRWSALPMSPLRGRSGAIAIWTGTSMIVWGGGLCDPECTQFTDGAAYLPA